MGKGVTDVRHHVCDTKPILLAESSPATFAHYTGSVTIS